MKRQVQSVGVRKWFGDDWINIQDELFAVLEGFFGNYNQQFILSGCEVDGTDISAGIVGLIDGEGFHLCRFSGLSDVAFPIYFYPNKVTENREYLDLEAKPVTETWQVASADEDGGSYFQLLQDGTSARFTDIIQNASRRFVTDAEKISYAAQASNAITTLRNGVDGDYDTLAKIATAILLLAPKANPAFTGVPTAPTAVSGTDSTQLATTAFVQAALAALVDSSPEALNTLNELSAALGDDPDFATTMINALAGKLNTTFDNIANVETAVAALGLTGAILGSVTYTDVSDTLKGIVTEDDGTWDFSASGIIEAAFTADTTIVLNNLQVNKTLKVKLTTTNSPVITLPDYVVPFDGNADPAENGTFYLYFECWNATTDSEEVTLTIIQQPA